MTEIKKIKAGNVKLKSKYNFDDELSDKIHCQCSFCEKLVTLSPKTRKLHHKLSGPNNFYCSFCLSNNLNKKDSRNYLLMSYRGILGYYYFEYYKNNNKMFMSQLKDFEEAHCKIGIENPLFKYDEKSMVWFVDFNRIGRGKHKLNVSNALQTSEDILNAFELKRIVSESAHVKILSKYTNAIMSFYKTRCRPKEKFILMPTFANTNAEIRFNKFHKPAYSMEKTKNFTFVESFE